MFHDPSCAASRRKIDPAGLHISIRKFCRVARCGFVPKPTRQGGFFTLRCILPKGAPKAHYFRAGRMDRPSPSSQEVKHV